MNDKKKKRSIVRSLILLVLFGAIVFTVFSSSTKEKVEMLQVGDEAPDFELVDLNGEKHRLSEYAGQGLFLNFWGTWCEPCKREFPIIDRKYQEYRNQGVQVLAVNIAESDFAVRNYIESKELTFPVVIDKEKSVMNAYNIKPLPTTFLINPDGEIIKIITGEMNETMVQQYMELIKPENI
ncbi:thiol-disulfide oxidoreductase ResA [Ureibacillus sinduriensis]|uniref:Thiol-disulfide oxidoreductase n=1 Tax=Ureibacillus sinduriensis BLB-1 = JCM 15800 TaxID=1384057 RepID=A0A0A3ILN7_9BACL|nr:thiol-disulfide oxidoreductase ResA [Ureibacillus sinduriensis]KGR75737.1 thiol-disulfide oxidoreductase [Ureibacillus sinduriensis BLB-1 = JCM 15800]